MPTIFSSSQGKIHYGNRVCTAVYPGTLDETFQTWVSIDANRLIQLYKIEAMAPLILLVAAFLLFRIVGIEWAYFSDWRLALRAALGVMFLLTASAHWGKRRADLIRMVPDRLGRAEAWVTVTGIAEIAIAIGLQIQPLALWVAAIAIAMLCCLFPANLKAAREHLTIGGKSVLPVIPRFFIQVFFIAALIGSI